MALVRKGLGIESPAYILATQEHGEAHAGCLLEDEVRVSNGDSQV